MTEQDVLTHESEAARAAMAAALTDLRASLTAATDVRRWTKEHPWAAVGVAATAGFAAAAVLDPTAPRKGSDGNSSAHPRNRGPSVNGHVGATETKADTAKKGPSAIWSLFLGPLFDLTKAALPALLAQLGRAVVARPPAPQESPASAAPADAASPQ